MLNLQAAEIALVSAVVGALVTVVIFYTRANYPDRSRAQHFPPQVAVGGEESGRSVTPTAGLEWRSLYGRVGRNSVWAGIGFAILTIVLLVLSVSTQYVVYEVDSVITFVAAVILLFRDPHARVQGRVLDAILLSSNRTMKDLSALDGGEFAYFPHGDSVDGVVVVPRATIISGTGSGLQTGYHEIIPPGRSLAVLFSREAGVSHPTLEVIQANLPRIMKENFGLAQSVSLDAKGDAVSVTIRGSSVPCGCNGGAHSGESKGSIGCTISSFLAVLVSASTSRPVLLGDCSRDDQPGTWIVPMTLESSSEERK